jgi:hypothetical protein
MMGFLTAPFLLTTRSVGSSLCLMALLSASLPSAFGEGHEAMEMCTPSLQLEISLPQDASITSKFGDTDHYLAATVDTVTVSPIISIVDRITIYPPTRSNTHNSPHLSFFRSGVTTTQMLLLRLLCSRVKLSPLRSSLITPDTTMPR